MEKKQWQKPELIVIVRNKPEEQVLAYCKGGGTTDSSLGHDEGCHSDFDCVTECRDPQLS
jgi:hypothetical protein